MVADEGRTVIFSSLLLDEVEQMSDYVFMMDEGRLVLEGPLDRVKEQHQLLSVEFGSAPLEISRIEGVLSAERRGPGWSLVCAGAKQQILASLGAAGGEVTYSRNASLQEIFVARVGRDRVTTLEA
jgi:ABC-2 type transport system ATP-binding protein